MVLVVVVVEEDFAAPTLTKSVSRSLDTTTGY